MSAPETRFAVLLFTDIVGSTELKARHGVPAFSEALRVHNAHFERIAGEHLTTRTLQNRGDGYFAEAGSIAEAVRFALLFQEAMRDEPWGDVRLAVCIGIHAGEVGAFEEQDGTWIVGPAADIAARVTTLAVGGQILLTRFPFDEARHFIREHPHVVGKTMPPLRWLAHGPYLMKGREEPMEIFEVGAEGLAPLAAPLDSEKAKRAIRPGEEGTLGWRPAVGLEIPGRTGWLLTERLGAGGFGEVWTGEHAKLHQRRAFKFCFDDERLRALKREVTLVRLLRSALGERDDIVHIHELKLDAPPFYLESDLAPHGNLLQWAERQGGLDKIPLAQRIGLVAHTATALAAAHSIGVLHKDIKPTNILIFDGPGGEPRPRLVDFGIGALTNRAVLGEHGVTAAGFTRTNVEHSTGTPTYSPPEYLAGKPYTVQGDIYGLGVLLYQLITAKPLDTLAPGWERDIADPLLREDIADCVDGDPARRFPSATDLAERLLHLDERRAEIEKKECLARDAAKRAEAEVAHATKRDQAKRLRKLVFAIAFLPVLGASRLWHNAEKSQKRAESELATMEGIADKAEKSQKRAESDLAEAAGSYRRIAEEKFATGFDREAFAYLARTLKYDPHSTFVAEMAAVALNVWPHLIPKGILFGHSGVVESAQFSPDSTRIVTASEDKTARVWDAATGKTLATLSGHKGRVESARFSPDGARIVTASYDHTAQVWDATTGKPLATFSGHESAVLSVQFSADGARIVTASSDHTARVWDSATGKPLATFSGHESAVLSAQFSADGTRIVTASLDRTARAWDSATGKPLATFSGHESAVLNVQFSADSSRIVTASSDQNARVWDAATGKTLAMLSGHKGRVESARFSPDGTRIVTASYDKTARVWDAATGKTLATLSGHERWVRSAQFSADSMRIVTASDDKTARVWDALTGKTLVTLSGHEGAVFCAQFSADGMRIVTISEEKAARVWDPDAGNALVTLTGHQSGASSAQFSADGTRIVTASDDKTGRVWDAATGKTRATLSGHEGAVLRAQFNAGGTRIVTASADKTARVWDAVTGKTLATLSGHEGAVLCAKFSPDGTRIVTASADKTARVWESATGKTLAALSGHEDAVLNGQFSPDGYRIVTASCDDTVRVWDAVTMRVLIQANLRAKMGRERWVRSAQFSPDSKRIVAALDKTARVWTVATGDELVTIAGNRNIRVMTAQFSPDGTRIVTASLDKTAGVWDAATGKRLVTLAGHEDGLDDAQFSPDGTRIVTASRDKTARIWTILPPTAGPPPEWFPDFLHCMAQMRLNSDGELETLKPDDWLALRERMRAVRRAGVGQDTPYLRILRRYVPE